MTTIRVPAPARRRMLPSTGVTAVAVLAILFGTVGVLGIARLVRPASAERNRTATAAATATATAAPPVAIVHASTIALGPRQIAVAHGGTLQLMNMGTEPVRLALQGTKRSKHRKRSTPASNVDLP